MKQILLGTIMLLNLHTANADDAFEIVVTKFKESINQTEQQQAMQTLNTIVTKLAGFKSRDYYYSNENQYWVDFVVWDDKSSAKQAAEQIMQNPKATDIFSLMDNEKSIFSHYQYIGGTRR